MFRFERQSLERFLQQVDFPTEKQDLINQAQQANLPHQVVLLLQRLDDKQYDSAEDVENQLAAHKA